MIDRILFAAIGVAIAIAIGYTVSVAGQPWDRSFLEWLGRTHPEDATLWAVLGAIVGVAISYIRRR
jgi:hypothetical protein